MRDYHLHTKLCGHAHGEMEDYVLMALERGLAEIGFSDHAPLYVTPKISVPVEKLSMRPKQFALYVDEVHRLQDVYAGEIAIRLGMEADYTPENLTAFDLADKYHVDYILGSIHYIDGWGFDQAEHAGQFDNYRIEDFYQLYIARVEEMVISGLIDIVAHIDLPKRYGPEPKDRLTTYRPLLTAIAEAGLAVEINTSGIYKATTSQPYPDPALVAEAARLNIPFTMGSDAHVSEHVGRGLEHAISVLQGAGIEKIAAYESRKRQMVTMQ